MHPLHRRLLLAASVTTLCALTAGFGVAAVSLVDVAEGALRTAAQVFSPLATRPPARIVPPGPRSHPPEPAKTPATPSEAPSFVSTSTREVGDAALAQTPSAETTPRCAGPLRLVGSMMAANDPSRSLAAIRMNGGTRLTQLDEKIGELTLVAIHPANAYFRRDDGSACRLPVFLPRAERTPPPPAPSPRASAPAIRPTGAELAELNAGIRKTGPNSYALTREVVGKALGSVTALRRSGRFQVKQESGRVVGMQLVRMRKDSPLARLGLQPGDIVRSLNGHDLTSPTGALGALQTARSQSAFSLALIRGGAPQSLRYEVQ